MAFRFSLSALSWWQGSISNLFSQCYIVNRISCFFPYIFFLQGTGVALATLATPGYAPDSRTDNKLYADGRHDMPRPLQVDNIFVFIRRVAPILARWLFKTSATSWPLTFWPWNSPSHVWHWLPLCQFLELGPMYATDVRQTDVRQKHRFMPPPYGGGGIIISRWLQLRFDFDSTAVLTFPILDPDRA